MNKPDENLMILRSLICNVSSARPKGENEGAVITLITRPMWIKFLEAIGEDSASEPRPGLSVYGSQTIIVESEKLVSVSFAR